VLVGGEVMDVDPILGDIDAEEVLWHCHGACPCHTGQPWCGFPGNCSGRVKHGRASPKLQHGPQRPRVQRGLVRRPV